MEDGTFVAVSVLACGELEEVFDCLGDYVAVEAHCDLQSHQKEQE